MSTVISTKGQSGLLEWLRSCPEHDWFVKIEPGSTVALDAAWQETAYLFRSPANARPLLDAAEVAECGETAERHLDRDITIRDREDYTYRRRLRSQRDCWSRRERCMGSTPAISTESLVRTSRLWPRRAPRPRIRRHAR
jgi:hypothetical protein